MRSSRVLSPIFLASQGNGFSTGLRYSVVANHLELRVDPYETSQFRRRTKIVATLGPATDDPLVLESVLLAGANVLRLNFSHGTPEQHQARVAQVREISARIGRDVGIMCDLQGPKIRIERFASGSAVIREGQQFVLDTDPDMGDGDESRVHVGYRNLVKDVSAGDMVLIDDGQIVLEVHEVEGSEVRCWVRRGGMLTNKKGLNKGGGGLSAPALADKDRADVGAAARLGVDFVSVSFARNADDIREARELVRAANGHASIVAKIERAEAVENIGEIIDASDVIMVARGDLAVEVGYAAMTGLQKGIIMQARNRCRVSITATQMLESMINSPSPTRAEVSDVANAVMDGTDAVMLSAETAVGRYPAEAVRTMSQLCMGAERHATVRRPKNYRPGEMFSRVDEAIANAAMYTANHLNVKAIIAFTESGSTALWMSRVRSDIPIYAFTRHESTRRRVTLYRGVYPATFDVVQTDPGEVYQEAIEVLASEGIVARGDRVLFTGGGRRGVSGCTDTLQILEVESDVENSGTGDVAGIAAQWQLSRRIRA